MFTKLRTTMKKLIVDTMGEDLAEVSSGLSKGAKTCIVLGCIAASAAGANALSNSSNSASDTAAPSALGGRCVCVLQHHANLGPPNLYQHRQ